MKQNARKREGTGRGEKKTGRVSASEPCDRSTKIVIPRREKIRAVWTRRGRLIRKSSYYPWKVWEKGAQ